MSSKIDERIVAMKFNNAQFSKGVEDTNKSLENLKKGLNLSDAIKKIGDFSGLTKAFSLSGIASGVEALGAKFSTLGIIGITALTNITNKAVDAGMQLAKSLTIDPILDGFNEYELKMGSIQTILANTRRFGTGLDEVTASLDELNLYADKTIYNFGDMTKNIGLFTNAGISIKDATSMIKGFSNEAAASGTNAQGAAGAAYQLSQALSAGTIRLMDWRSLTNVGMGNKNMQNGLIEIADAMGTLSEASISAEDVQSDFNGSLEKNWLSADVMSNYLKIMAGDMDDAAMSALGLSDAQIQAFHDQASTAEDAATKVRTWTQLIGTLQESVGSGWAQTFDILIGDFEQATTMWTAVNDALGPIIDGMSQSRNDMLQAWADLGGRDLGLKAIGNAFTALKNIITPIVEAFQEIFPPATGQQLYDITAAVEKFTASLIPSAEQMDQIKRTFKGLFAVLDIGWMVLQQVIGLFARLFGASTQGAGGILKMTASLGDFLVGLRDTIKNGDGLAKVFKVIGDVLQAPIDGLKWLYHWLRENVLNLQTFQKAWGVVVDFFKRAAKDFQPIVDFFKNLTKAVKPAQDAVDFTGPTESVKGFGKVLGEVWTNIKNFFSGLDPNWLTGIFNAGVIGGFAITVGLMFKKLVDAITGFTDIFSGSAKKITEKIGGAFDSLTDTMSAMQSKLKAEALIKIAIAVGLLAGALIILSLIDTPKLIFALGAMSILFAQLTASMVAMDKGMSALKPGQMIAMSVGLIAMGVALILVATAIKMLSDLSWQEMGVGLTSLTGGLVLLIGATKVLAKDAGSMARIGAGLIVMASSFIVLAVALRMMSSLSWPDIIKGLVGMGGALVIVTSAAKFAEANKQGAVAMLIISTALVTLGASLMIMAKMSWDEILKALVTLAGSLLVMGGALRFIQGQIKGAAAMLIVTVAITALAGAFKIFATMSWDDIGRALVVLAGGLVILAGAMALMGIPLVMAGSVGILAASVAMMMLAPALKLLGSMTWDDIGRGLTVLAAGLVILAAGGLLLIPAIPAFLALGIAAGLIGLGALAAGVGLSLMAVGITALAAAAAVGSQGIKIALDVIISMIPAAMAAFAQGIIDFALVIVNGGTAFTEAMTTLLMSLINAINNVAPAIIDTLFMLLNALIDKITENLPKWQEKGLQMITKLLEGIANNIGKITTAATKVVTEFIDSMGRNIPKIVESGMQFIINLVNGIAEAVRRNSKAMRAAGKNLADAIVEGMVGGIQDGVQWISDTIGNLARGALNTAKRILGIKSPSRRFREIGSWTAEGMAEGVSDGSSMVDDAVIGMGKSALSKIRSAMATVSDEASANMDFSPVIKPVLDLGQYQRDMKSMELLSGSPVLDLKGTYVSGLSAMQAQADTTRTSYESKMPESTQQLVFEQNNYSPKALTASELYRQTSNLMSVAKRELTT